jgi:hypothetical protein
MYIGMPGGILNFFFSKKRAKIQWVLNIDHMTQTRGFSELQRQGESKKPVKGCSWVGEAIM